MRFATMILLAAGLAFAADTPAAPALSKEAALEIENTNLQIKANTEKITAVEKAMNDPLREKVNSILGKACDDAKIDQRSCQVNTSTSPWTLVDASAGKAPAVKK